MNLLIPSLLGILISKIVPIDISSNYLKSAIKKHEKDEIYIVNNMCNFLENLKIEEKNSQSKNHFSKSYEQLFN